MNKMTQEEFEDLVNLFCEQIGNGIAYMATDGFEYKNGKVSL